MATKKNTISHDRRKNPTSREKWISEKRAGRPKQTYDLATKTYTKTFPSGVKV